MMGDGGVYRDGESLQIGYGGEGAADKPKLSAIGVWVGGQAPH